ncbi:TPA: hypothetical protein ACJXXX_004520 [Pseudomonas aeruginosa]
MTESKICTCPSGNGSLRHPCPAHPASVEQAGGDERAAFELFVRKHCGMPEHIAVNWDAKFTNDAWEGWKARAALAQPSQAIAAAPTYQFQSREIGESDWAPCDFRWYLYCSKSPEMDTRVVEVAAQPSPAQAGANVGHGHVFPRADGVKMRCGGPGLCPECSADASRARTALAQHSPAQAEQAEAERPEVGARVVHSNPVVLGQCGPLNANDELMTVAQHAASVARWAEMFNRVEQQRDAALARVAELEKQVAVAWGAFHFGGERDGKLYTHCETEAQIDAYILDMHRSSDSLTLRKSPLYAAPFAQNQPTVPEGWKLVPVEPTEDVLEAIHNGGYVGDDQELRWFYQSILAAAPAPGGE